MELWNRRHSLATEVITVRGIFTPPPPLQHCQSTSSNPRISSFALFFVFSPFLSSFIVQEMEYVTQKILQAVSQKMDTYYNTGNLQVLLKAKPTHFFEIKSHLEASTSSQNIVPKNVLREVRNILLSNMKVMQISELSNEKQVSPPLFLTPLPTLLFLLILLHRLS